MSWRMLAVPLLCGSAFAQLPAVPVPPGNPLTPAKVVLGKILFWEEQLSSDDTVACGTCHLPESGGADPRVLGAIHPGPDFLFGTADDIHGTRGIVKQTPAGDYQHEPLFGLAVQVTRRYAPGNLGVVWHDMLFWDGRASPTFVDPETSQTLIPYGGALESQAVGPILNPVEMGQDGRTWQDVRLKLQNARPLALAQNLPPDVQGALQQNPTYPLLFTAAFGDPAITAARIAFALASYQRVLIPDDTPWDRFQAGQTAALTPNQQAGWNEFQTTGQCVACHMDPLFTDDMFHVLGLREAREDKGFGGFYGIPAEDGAFKTPALRNAGLRPRLFHNGQSPALGDPTQTTDPASVANIYLNGGGIDRTNLDPFLAQQGQISATEMAQMLDFVQHGLTDPRAAQALPPFDHPTLRSYALPPPLVQGQGLAGACEPFLVDTSPPWPGNPDWRLGFAAGDGQTLGCIGYGLRPMPGPVTFGGLPWNIEVNDARLVWLHGAAGAPGVATWHLAVPPDTGLSPYDFWFQLWALDPLAPNGISTSKGWRFQVR